MPKQHHCSYRTCTKSKSACTEHYWTCTGTPGAVHQEQKIFQGKACESNVRRNGELETCGNTESCEYLLFTPSILI